MKAKDQYLLETWPKQQAKGKTAYMSFHALFYGVIVGVLSLIFELGNVPVMELILSKEYLFKLVLFTAIGLIMANYKWKANNRKYEELKSQHEELPD